MDISAENVAHTCRGFQLLSFVDCDGLSCSLQESSLMAPKCIWLGPILENIAIKQIDKPWKTMSKEDIRKACGFEHVGFADRMHLTQKHVARLLPLLQQFVDKLDAIKFDGQDQYDERYVLRTQATAKGPRLVFGSTASGIRLGFPWRFAPEEKLKQIFGCAQVEIRSLMLLNRKQVSSLIPMLKHFQETGKLASAS